MSIEYCKTTVLLSDSEFVKPLFCVLAKTVNLRTRETLILRTRNDMFGVVLMTDFPGCLCICACSLPSNR